MRHPTRFVLVASALLLGCATGPSQSKLMKQAATSEMSPDELRIRVRAKGPRFSGKIEEIADEIVRRNPTPAMRKAMTQFKMNSVPAMQNALFQADPAAAVIDTWAFLAQLEDVLDHYYGLDAPSREYARKQFESLEGEVADLWRQLRGQPDDARMRVHRWAAENPITDTVASRVPTTALLANVTAQEKVAPLQAAADILSVTQDITARLDTQTTFLPKMARWQAEYFMLEAIGDPTMHPPIPELSAALSQTGQVTDELRKLPAFIDHQRDTILSSVHQDIRSERLGLQSFVTQERQATMADAERLARSTVDHTFDRAGAMLDRILIWASAVLLLGAIWALVAIALITRRRLPRRYRIHEGDAFIPDDEGPEEHAPH